MNKVESNLYYAFTCAACSEMNWRNFDNSKTGAREDKCEHCGRSQMVLVGYDALPPDEPEFIDNNDMAFIIREAMKERGESNNDLARRMHYDPGYIRSMVCGSGTVSTVLANEFGYTNVKHRHGEQRMYMKIKE